MLKRERMIARRMFDMVDDLQQQQQQQQQMFIRRYPSSSSQRYELIDNNEKFELKVDIPGVKEADLDIKLDDGKLTIEGQRMATSDTSRFTSKFSKSFSLDKTVDVDKFTASLNNGVLVVSAPKDLAKLEENIRRIPISSSSSVADDTTLAEAENEIGPGDSQQEEHEEGVPNEEKVKIPSSSSPEEEADNETLDLDASNKV